MSSQTNGSPKQERGLTRRNFLRMGFWAALALLGIEVSGATLASLWPNAKSASGSTKITAGKPSDYPIGSVTHFPDGRFFLARVDAGFLAMSAICTHLGCVVPWKPDEKSEDNLASTGRFNCPCHGSVYDRHGQVIIAPAPRPLDLYPITLEEGKLVVDTGTVIKRDKFEPSQALKA